MGKGKLVSQGAHAALAAFLRTKEKAEWRRWAEVWLKQGMKKVALRVKNEEEMNALVSKAQTVGLPTALIRDAGYTQVPAGSVTAAAIGPGPEELVQPITGHLKLL